jgi:hypothetical protein
MLILTVFPDDVMAKILRSVHTYKAHARLSMTCRAGRARFAGVVAQWKNAMVFMEQISARLHKQVAARVHKKVKVCRVCSDGEYSVQTALNKTNYASVLLFEPHGVLVTLYYEPRTFRHGSAATCVVKYDVQDRTVRVEIGDRLVGFRFDTAADAVATLVCVLRSNQLWK